METLDGGSTRQCRHEDMLHCTFKCNEFKMPAGRRVPRMFDVRRLTFELRLLIVPVPIT